MPRAPTLAEVIELRQHDPGSLENAAMSINRHIDLFLRAASSHCAHRVRAGIELIAVRKRIPHGEWETWCADNIHRSMRDIRRLMRMAGADDPEAAAEEERSNAREGMRANRTNVSPLRLRPFEEVGVGPVQQVFRLFLRFNAAQRAEFFALVKKEMER